MALATTLALLVDALAGTQLLMRSLIGPDPSLGARFYGIGNELKSGLAVLMLAAVAAALYPAARRTHGSAGDGRRRRTLGRRRGIGAHRRGCGRRDPRQRRIRGRHRADAPRPSDEEAGAASPWPLPLAGLVALALLDLATAHGSGHYTGSILHARSAGDLRDVIVRRYGAAWDELHNHAMPLATAAALLAGAFGLRRSERLLAPVRNDPAWRAALAGGLAAGVVGALVEDSGPVLLVVAVFALGLRAELPVGAPGPPAPGG